MRTKHTPQEAKLEAAFASILETADDDTVALVLNHLELSRHAIDWMMEREVRDLAGERYSHDKPHDGQYNRWSSNPGSVAVGGQKLRVDVPRIRDMVNRTVHSPEIYSKLRAMQEPPLHIMQALMRGLGTRQYKETKRSSTRFLIVASMARPTLPCGLIDGKVLQNQSMVIAIGITDQGFKRTLGLTQATTQPRRWRRRFTRIYKQYRSRPHDRSMKESMTC